MYVLAHILHSRFAHTEIDKHISNTNSFLCMQSQFYRSLRAKSKPNLKLYENNVYFHINNAESHYFSYEYNIHG